MPLLRAKEIIKNNSDDDILTDREKVIEKFAILFAAATTFGFFFKIILF